MKQYVATYNVAHLQNIKQQILAWANQFNVCCFFNNNFYKNNYNSYEILVGVSNKNKFIKQNNREELEQIFTAKYKWLFGHIAYDFKEELFDLKSNNKDETCFENLSFFEPENVLYLNNDVLTIESDRNNTLDIFQEVIKTQLQNTSIVSLVSFSPIISKHQYIEIINKIKYHIQIGDCYELNFCQEFFANNVDINPIQIYEKLNKISPTPFSVFYKLKDKYVICASPERFTKKEGNKIISQPIKGTIKRNLSNQSEDDFLKIQLKQSQKERSENVMIVDLVRNDLSKICHVNTVKVEEMMEVYSFKQVHHLISTVVGELRPDINFYEVLKALFPMGSMTGAPKYKVMQLIEKHEKSKRNIYSGSIGYIAPNNNFDFNVVIRSLVYNSSSKYLSYQVGSAITHYSNAEQEYDECLLKAKAIQEVFNT